MKKLFLRIKVLFASARYWLRVGGLPSLITHFIKYIATPFYDSKDYYLVRYNLESIPLGFDTEYFPDIKIKTIRVSGEMDDLKKEVINFDSYISLTPSMNNYEQQLKSGGILFCAIRGNELVHTRWAALNERAKALMNTVPLAIDYTTETYFGGAFTIPKMRGSGLHPYLFKYAAVYCIKMGLITAKSVILKDNSPSLATAHKMHGVVYGEVRESRFLRWKFTKTKINKR